MDQVGGDLVINDASRCPEIILKKQPLFQAISHGTVFFEINNTGGGNRCVTLIIETATATIKTEIPENAQTGILKFNKVKKTFLILSRNVNDSSVQTLTSIGSAKVWF